MINILFNKHKQQGTREGILFNVLQSWDKFSKCVYVDIFRKSNYCFRDKILKKSVFSALSSHPTSHSVLRTRQDVITGRGGENEFKMFLSQREICKCRKLWRAYHIEKRWGPEMFEFVCYVSLWPYETQPLGLYLLICKMMWEY